MVPVRWRSRALRGRGCGHLVRKTFRRAGGSLIHSLTSMRLIASAGSTSRLGFSCHFLATIRWTRRTYECASPVAMTGAEGVPHSGQP